MKFGENKSCVIKYRGINNVKVIKTVNTHRMFHFESETDSTSFTRRLFQLVIA